MGVYQRTLFPQLCTCNLAAKTIPATTVNSAASASRMVMMSPIEERSIKAAAKPTKRTAMSNTDTNIA